MTKPAEAKVVQKFSQTAEQVFDAWLDPVLVKQWMTAALKSMQLPGDIRRIEIDARRGGKFTFSDMRAEGEAVHWGTYKEMVRPVLLEFTWFTTDEDEKEDMSLVTLTITPQAQSCAATMTHRLPIKYAEYIAQTEMGWGTMLARIAEL